MSDDCACPEDKLCEPEHPEAGADGCYDKPPPMCGDGVCNLDAGEDCLICSLDCACPTGTMCDPSKTKDRYGCYETGSVCGNGQCETGLGEHCANCLADCACKPPAVCNIGSVDADPKGCANL